MELDRILVPVDGSDYSLRAARYALNLGKTLNSEIVLVHCRKQVPLYLGEPYFQEAHDRIVEHTEKLMQPFRDLLSQNGISVTERILEGRPAAMICESARIENCDLIVMGSRGRSDWQGLLLGSVTHRVLQATPVPVLVIR
jgi:nucleotide-binding universal stress UspA family protein